MLHASSRHPSKQFIRCFILLAAPLVALNARAESTTSTFPFRDGDRVAWIGSSSTKIGIWPRTMEFLLHTRHPELKFESKSFTTGGGTFATGLQHIDKWLDEFNPTLVFFNYGGNDASLGDAGIPKFLETMEQCVVKAQDHGARVVLLTPQAADVRKSGETAAANREAYANLMVRHGRSKGWTVIDTHHPLGAMQAAAEKEDPTYSMLKDKIHLTNAAYIGWGYFLYQLLTPPSAASSATITEDGRVTSTVNCEIVDISSNEGNLTFTRIDKVLPILPPAPLPPRHPVPLEPLSRYELKATGLTAGLYEVLCNGQTVGNVEARDLGAGINLNSLVLDGGQQPPWQELAEQIWAGEQLDQIGHTSWKFEIRKK